MSATAYPLTWPKQFPRVKTREAGRFKTSLSAALKNVQESLRLFAADSDRKLEGLVISSNVTLGAHRPADPGVAIWFEWDGLQVCIAVDRYSSVESNLQAIHHIVEARRVELRHGTLALVRATFTGFLSLPAPKGTSWREVLDIPSGVTPTKDELDKAYRRAASRAHPDKAGGSTEAMAAVNLAMDEARAELDL